MTIKPPAPRAPLLDTRFMACDLPRLRLRITECAERSGLCESRRDDFVLAVHEVLSNAIEHGGGEGRLVAYNGDGMLHCRITDDGPGFSADIIPPEPPGLETGERGRGLWLTRHLTDHLDIGLGTVGAIVTLAITLGA
ncbi:ATP-binding protein [Streptomyces sp. Act143]|uniref:ATP-binding protein n=1 Tax=Streptomyces sp. Act143 TaxID=2200760 RepID=UPI000D67B7D0|nr:ATP-binding protein [Streptomyces sp. Act143]PWI12614.1 ATP-binding protein [Streptomyces sp. Act143]